MEQARALHQTTGKAARVFTGFAYITHKSWSRARRVAAKTEYLDKGQNPRFVVTSLTPEEWSDQARYEKFYCARGEMENRIKEQMCLFADRLSTDEMKGNQLRLYFSALAYTMIEALRRLGLEGTEWAEAQVDTIRLKLLKIGAIVRVSVRRIVLQFSSTYAWKDIFAQAFRALRCGRTTRRLPTQIPRPLPTRICGAMPKIETAVPRRTAESPKSTTCLHPNRKIRSGIGGKPRFALLCSMLVRNAG
jgi:hypothetical protein